MALYVFLPSAGEHDGSLTRLQITRGGKLPLPRIIIIIARVSGSGPHFWTGPVSPRRAERFKLPWQRCRYSLQKTAVSDSEIPEGISMRARETSRDLEIMESPYIYIYIYI